MNLLQVVHQRWAADATLNGLLPAANVYTGMSVTSATPYAVIAKTAQRPVAYHNDGSTVDAVHIRIDVFDDEYDSAVAIANEVKALLDCSSFDLSGSDRVIGIRRENDYHRHEEDGIWRIVLEFKCTVYLSAGT